MSVSITVQGEGLAAVRAELAVVLNALGGTPVQDSPVASVTEPKKGPGRPAKAGKTAAEMAAEMGLAAPAPAAAAPATPAPAPTITEEQIRAKLTELMSPRTGDADEMAGMSRVQAVLAKLGVQQIKAVPAARYAELAAYIDAA